MQPLSGLIIVYWCKDCKHIETIERSCPFCNGHLKEIGWVEDNG